MTPPFAGREEGCQIRMLLPGVLRHYESCGCRRQFILSDRTLYAVLLTALHLPFPMITRLRIPFMNPLITTLVGGFYRLK